MSDEMSLEDVARALSEHEHLGCLDWYVVKLNGDEDIVCGVGVEDYLPATEARSVLAELTAANAAEGDEMSDDVKLEPCPNPACQSDDVEHSEYGNLGNDWHYVYCGVCGMRGPNSRDAATAEAAWNALPRKAAVGPESKAVLDQVARSLRAMPPSPDFKFGLRPAFAVVVENPQAFLAELEADA